MVDFLLHPFHCVKCCVDTEQTVSPYPKELSGKATFKFGTDALKQRLCMALVLSVMCG